MLYAELMLKPLRQVPSNLYIATLIVYLITKVCSISFSLWLE